MKTSLNIEIVIVIIGIDNNVSDLNHKHLILEESVSDPPNLIIPRVSINNNINCNLSDLPRTLSFPVPAPPSFSE